MFDRAKETVYEAGCDIYTDTGDYPSRFWWYRTLAGEIYQDISLWQCWITLNKAGGFGIDKALNVRVYRLGFFKITIFKLGYMI